MAASGYKGRTYDKYRNSGHIYKLNLRPNPESNDTKALPSRLSSTPSDRKKEIKSEGDTSFSFFVLGCGENDPKPKKPIAELMNEIARGGKKPDFIILLGDNFNEDGVKSPYDPQFKAGFHDVYHLRELEAIWGIPFFVIPGNHDHGFPFLYPIRTTGITNNLEKIGHEVNHTYVHESKEVLDPKKQEFFAKDSITIEELKALGQTWIMPGRFYGLEIANKEFFFIDSNTYIKEYIQYFLKGNKSETNRQPLWLETFAKNPATAKFLFLHHSLYSEGKRAFLSDAKEYLSVEDINLLIDRKIIENKEESYNEILRRILKKQGLEFEAVFAAHDHNMCHFNNQANTNDKLNPKGIEGLLKLIIAGGAGGKLQNRFNFNSNTQCFIKRHGFVNVEMKGDATIINYHSIQDPELKKFGIRGHHIQFNLDSVIPNKESPDDPDLALLHDLTVSACNEYLKNNPPPINITKLPFYKSIDDWGMTKKLHDHVPDDCFYAEDLLNHFKRFEANNFEETHYYLQYALGKSPSLSEVFFNQSFFKKKGIGYEEFATLSLAESRKLFFKPKEEDELKTARPAKEAKMEDKSIPKCTTQRDLLPEGKVVSPHTQNRRITIKTIRPKPLLIKKILASNEIRQITGNELTGARLGFKKLKQEDDSPSKELKTSRSVPQLHKDRVTVSFFRPPVPLGKYVINKPAARQESDMSEEDQARVRPARVQ